MLSIVVKIKNVYITFRKWYKNDIKESWLYTFALDRYDVNRTTTDIDGLTIFRFFFCLSIERM